MSRSPRTQQGTGCLHSLHNLRSCFHPGSCLGSIWDRIYRSEGLTHHARTELWVFSSGDGGLLNLLKPSPSSAEWGYQAKLNWEGRLVVPTAYICSVLCLLPLISKELLTPRQTTKDWWEEGLKDGDPGLLSSLPSTCSYPSSPNTLSLLSNPNSFSWVPKHHWLTPLPPFAHNAPSPGLPTVVYLVNSWESFKSQFG